MAAQNPPVNGVAYTVYLALQDFANPGAYKANPTLASGDVKVSIDGGAFSNLTTLPAVTPAAGIAVKLALSASEMTGDNIFVQFIDQTSPKEWADFALCIQPVAGAWNVGKTGYALSSAGNNSAADALLDRDLTEVAAPAARSPMNALRKLMNKVSLSGATLTVMEEDDATPAYTQAVTTNASQAPISALDTN